MCVTYVSGNVVQEEASNLNILILSIASDEDIPV